jgi:hypothetical protein
MFPFSRLATETSAFESPSNCKAVSLSKSLSILDHFSSFLDYASSIDLLFVYTLFLPLLKNDGTLSFLFINTLEAFSLSSLTDEQPISFSFS